ncbi:hypothetical protein TVAG_166130 [Trichomonas vaginalis G3]|uniref:Uncharacterized protein n=1 Tax=Trichomonas vaginalis (strain ATCC PRA-98 / G3) TaxID=412133 RepID=A2DE20_TRIV3|nr:hypothetical protein TVAGG3_0174030 [Trichomonas vaginalis G3]EAY21238.1 hypothetical protein TVAG_166130 [Trichomonas vaginalis G3]KAI5548801.1 hypothetical protein TVAGG3_0174030 [Trichomonas vaginalis G3]|eukprot:XP_001582224.1 hypothetical protein [Trichomonas vaginalis G3]
MFLYLAFVESYFNTNALEQVSPEAVSNSYSEEDLAYKFKPIETLTKGADYNTADLGSLIDTISNEFHIDRDRLDMFFRRVKFAQSAKQLFNKIDYGRNNQRAILFMRGSRSTDLYGAVIKVVKTGNTYQVNVREALTSACVYAMTRITERHHHNKKQSLKSRLLKGWEVQEVYNKLNAQIAGYLNEYKNI